MSNEELRIAIDRFRGAERAIKELLAQGGELRAVGNDLRSAAEQIREAREDVRRLAAALEAEAGSLATAGEAIRSLDPAGIRRELGVLAANLDRVRTRTDEVAGENVARINALGDTLAGLLKEAGDRLSTESEALRVDLQKEMASTRNWVVAGMVAWVGLLVVFLIYVFSG